MQFHNFKIVYKRYAGLYFALCIDLADNELLHLEVIIPWVSWSTCWWRLSTNTSAMCASWTLSSTSIKSTGSSTSSWWEGRCAKPPSPSSRTQSNYWRSKNDLYVLTFLFTPCLNELELWRLLGFNWVQADIWKGTWQNVPFLCHLFIDIQNN